MPPSSSSASGSSIASENRWLASTFSLPHASSIDFYLIAQQQYKVGRYNVVIKCLEIYVRRVVEGQIVHTEKGENTTAASSTSKAALAIPHPIGLVTSTPTRTSLPIGPFHLLAYAHYRLGHLQTALECFLACVRLGYETDWQMIVQCEHELEVIRVKQRKEDESLSLQAREIVKKHRLHGGGGGNVKQVMEHEEEEARETASETDITNPTNLGIEALLSPVVSTPEDGDITIDLNPRVDSASDDEADEAQAAEFESEYRRIAERNDALAYYNLPSLTNVEMF